MVQDINAALDTLNTCWSGASAPSSPEAGQFWHDTTANVLKMRSLDNTTWISLFTLNETAYTAATANLPTLVPQGRLTLTSNTPVQTGEAVNATALYYTPYLGAYIPIYTGTVWQNLSFAQLTLTLNTGNHLSGKVYDVFIFNNSGTLTIATGPAWTNTTSRSAAITQLNGLWVNNASITLINNATTYTGVAANTATYVGSFYATANGQTGNSLRPAAANGGNNNIIGVFNAYNRLRASARSQDNTASWTYNVAIYRPANNSTSNRVNWLDGLSVIYTESKYLVTAGPNGQGLFTGVGVDSTVTPSDVIGVLNSGVTTTYGTIEASVSSYPLMGLHYVQALEATNNTNPGTFYGTFSATNMAIYLTTEI